MVLTLLHGFTYNLSSFETLEYHIMAGHNKWSKLNILKHVKTQKRQRFKVGRDITVAARQGGDNPDMNPALRLAIKRQDVNIPQITFNGH